MKLNVIWATLAGAVTLMILGFLLYVVLLGNLLSDLGMSADCMREPPNLLVIFFGNVAGALLLAHVFSRWAGITTFATGAKAGAIIGVLVSLYAGLIQFGTTTIADSITPYLLDAVISAILWAVGGGVVGLILGKTASAE